MLKKTIALAMTAGVVAAMALPTTAAANWKHHDTDIQEDITVGLTGNVRFQGSLGGIECQVTSRVKFEPGTTGVAETFVPHPSNETTNCKGLGGMAPCQIHNITPQTPNWIFHTTSLNGQAVGQVTSGTLQSQLTGGFFCVVKKVTLKPSTEPGAEAFIIPNQPNTVTSAQSQAKLVAQLETNSGAVHQEIVTVSGEGIVEDEIDEHTYSI